MKKILLIFLAGVFLAGCATAPIGNQQRVTRTGNMTSEPSGANIYFVDFVKGKQLLAKTPSPIVYQDPSPLWGETGRGWIIVSFPGYEDNIWQVPKEGPIDHNFVLEKDISQQIKESNPPKDKEYLKRIIDIVGRCDKMLHSPRMLAAGVVSEANSEYQKLQIAVSYTHLTLPTILRV